MNDFVTTYGDDTDMYVGPLSRWIDACTITVWSRGQYWFHRDIECGSIEHKSQWYWYDHHCHRQVDLVTETDKACEKLIFQHLKQTYPNHQFIGEETSAVYGTADLTDAPTWIIDPLDGTTNFVHRHKKCTDVDLGLSSIHGLDPPKVSEVTPEYIDCMYGGTTYGATNIIGALKGTIAGDGTYILGKALMGVTNASC
eukprot:Gb_36926 [translate_table: standard]